MPAACFFFHLSADPNPVFYVFYETLSLSLFPGEGEARTQTLCVTFEFTTLVCQVETWCVERERY